MKGNKEIRAILNKLLEDKYYPTEVALNEIQKYISQNYIPKDETNILKETNVPNDLDLK